MVLGGALTSETTGVASETGATIQVGSGSTAETLAAASPRTTHTRGVTLVTLVVQKEVVVLTRQAKR